MKKTIDMILYEGYLTKLRKEKRFIFITQMLIFVVFLISWELLSRFSYIDPLIFSSPSKVMWLLYEKTMDGTMIPHLFITVSETVIGFLLGTIAGIAIASTLWASERFAGIADPYLVILNAMPKVALGPIIIVALGPGFFSIIMMGAIISVIITTIVVYTAFREVNVHYEHVLKTLGATKKQIFQEAIFPATMPTMISSLKVNVGLSWVGVIVGEFLVADKGLGFLIIYGFQVFDFTLVMASLVIIAIFAAIMYKTVERIEKKLLK